MHAAQTLSVKSTPVGTPHKHASRLDADTIALGSVRSVQRRIAAVGGIVALVLVGALAWGSSAWLGSLLEGQPAERVQGAQDMILLGSAVLLGVIELALLFLGRYVARRVTEPAITLAHSKVFMPMNKRVLNYTLSPLGTHSFRYVDVQE